MEATILDVSFVVEVLLGTGFEKLIRKLICHVDISGHWFLGQFSFREKLMLHMTPRADNPANEREKEIYPQRGRSLLPRSSEADLIR